MIKDKRDRSVNEPELLRIVIPDQMNRSDEIIERIVFPVVVNGSCDIGDKVEFEAEKNLHLTSRAVLPGESGGQPANIVAIILQCGSLLPYRETVPERHRRMVGESKHIKSLADGFTEVLFRSA
jgi:hypothetical protein